MLTGCYPPPKIAVARAAFPMLGTAVNGHPLVYLDSAATAHKPQCVIDALSAFYAGQYATVHRAVYSLSLQASDAFQDVREQVRAFINAEKSEEIIFTRGTTASINTVAYSFGKAFIRPGDEIIISELEHHSNIVPWQMMCEERGAILRVIPADDRAVLDIAAYGVLLNERTRLVAIGHISNAFGTVNPVQKIAAMAHSAGAVVLVDGAQAAPHQPIDVRELGADFYAFSGHKAYGPTGVGILYGRAELLDAMPPYQGGGDMIDTVTFEKTTYNVLPLKFEAGTPMIAEVIGLGAALKFLSDLGLQDIHDWEQQLLSYATARLAEVDGITLLGRAPEKGAILSFAVAGVHPLDVGTLLDLRGVAVRTGLHCAQPAFSRYALPGSTRASFALYNTFAEIDIFIAALVDVLRLLRL